MNDFDLSMTYGETDPMICESSAPDAVHYRSNVMPATNVARRDPDKPLITDREFRQHVRGGKAIKWLINLLRGSSMGNLDARGQREVRKLLTQAQFQQQNDHLRCPLCDRIEYGPVARCPDGSLKWAFLDEKTQYPCRCKR